MNRQADKQFLDRDPNKRLGFRPGGGGFADVQAHPWFKGIDLEALHNKEVIPPFEPDVSRSGPMQTRVALMEVETGQL